MWHRRDLDKGRTILSTEEGSDKFLRNVSNKLHGAIVVRLKS
jgi:hypothetical protein